MEVCSKTTCLGAAAGDCFCRLQFGAARGDADFQHELFPLHSPLLRESWLVSFPPLSNMLKSSGSSYLIGGPKGMPRLAACARPARLFLSTRRMSAGLPPRLSFGYKSSHAEETDHRRLCTSGDAAPRAATGPQSAAPRPRRELSAAGTRDPTQRRRGG